MIIITNDMITSAAIATVMKDRGGNDIDSSAEFHAHLEGELRSAPASNEISQMILAYFVASAAFENDVDFAKLFAKLPDRSTILMVTRFIAMGIAIGMNLSEKLVRDVKLAQLAESTKFPEPPKEG